MPYQDTPFLQSPFLIHEVPQLLLKQISLIFYRHTCSGSSLPPSKFETTVSCHLMNFHHKNFTVSESSNSHYIFPTHFITLRHIISFRISKSSPLLSHELRGQHPLQFLSLSSSLLSHISIPSFLLHPHSMYLSPHTIVITDVPTLFL